MWSELLLLFCFPTHVLRNSDHQMSHRRQSGFRLQPKEHSCLNFPATSFCLVRPIRRVKLEQAGISGSRSNFRCFAIQPRPATGQEGPATRPEKTWRGTFQWGEFVSQNLRDARYSGDVVSYFMNGVGASFLFPFVIVLPFCPTTTTSTGLLKLQYVSPSLSSNVWQILYVGAAVA